jgi:hypothetical protein
MNLIWSEPGCAPVDEKRLCARKSHGLVSASCSAGFFTSIVCSRSTAIRSSRAVARRTSRTFSLACVAWRVRLM